MKAFFLHLAYSLFYNVNKLLNISFQLVTSKHFIQLLTYIYFVNKNSISVLEIASSRIKFDLCQQKPLIDKYFFVSDLRCIFHCFAK